MSSTIVRYAGDSETLLELWWPDADDAGAPLDLTGYTLTGEVYNPASGEQVLSSVGTITAQAAPSGDGAQVADVPSLVVELDGGAAGLVFGRYRLRITATLEGRSAVRSWPYGIRP